MVPRAAQSHSLNLLLGWSLLAFGGVYVWALAPAAAASVLLLLLTRPRLASGEERQLDVSLAVIPLVIVLQLVPLPRGIVAAVSPGSLQMSDALALGNPRPFVPLSVWPAGTLEALVVVVTATATFWCARDLFRHEGVRRSVRTIALVGGLASFAGLLQRKSGAALLYGFWQPLETGAWPFGPFVNRNYFATWVLMAIPVCAGYLVARGPARGRPEVRPLRVRVAHALDGRGIWLLTVLGLMTVALVASQSRSGAIGLLAVLVVGFAGARRRGYSRRQHWLALGVVAVGIAVVLWGDLPGLATRFEQARVLEGSERQAIWRDTVSLVKSQWLAGAGAGAYERAMLFFQTTDRTYYDNHAHNQYLQVAAEGGLLLVIPVAVALWMVIAGGARHLRRDRTGMYWFRLGAAAGLAAVAVQGFWETGLRAPANAILSAVLAAILLHEPIAADQTNRTRP